MPQVTIQNPQLFLGKLFLPSITTWNRLEGRPRRREFTRSLRVEVRDPLWMLCRQWQFGEFKHEDAGSAVEAKVQITTTKINRYAPDGSNALPYADATPLETVVEREAIPADLAARITAGRHWVKLLQQSSLIHLKQIYLSTFGFEKPSPTSSDPDEQEALAHLESDRKALATWAAVDGRLVDGLKLLASIQAGDHDTWADGNIPTEEHRVAAKETAQQFLAWFERVFSAPRAQEKTAWRPSYLEYQFACSAPADSAGEGQVVLKAEEYHQGHLDWYAFDIASDSTQRLSDVGSAPAGVLNTPPPISFVVSQIEFGGMPNVRWWEFEDRQTDFGGLTAGTTDIPLLMLAEFGLIYGNDWTIVPYDLEVGTLCDVQGIVVTDVFGVRTFVRAAGTGRDEDWQHWSMYNLSRLGEGGSVDTRLFLPPAIGKMQEGKPVETVVLTRDEMANMVWGIEETTPGVIGKGVKGFEAATQLANYLTGPGAVSPPPPGEGAGLDAEAARIRYRLGTTVPENWIPLIAVHNPGSNREIRLQRAAMPRLTDQLTGTLVRPRGVVLRHGLDAEPPQPYFIHEEQVPRAGALVTRSYQRTRWFDGKTYTWIGRRKQTGRGEGASGLEFDRIVPVGSTR